MTNVLYTHKIEIPERVILAKSHISCEKLVEAARLRFLHSNSQGHILNVLKKLILFVKIFQRAIHLLVI